MWDVKCFVVAVAVGATGIVTKELEKYRQIMPGDHLIDCLQKQLYWEQHT
jgi:hypothetical protein